jgi:hypothetical protein
VTIRRATGAIVAAVVVIAFAACAKMMNTPEFEAMRTAARSIPGVNKTPGLEVHAVRSIKTVVIHKIAVMPLVEAPDQVDKTLPQGATEAVSAELYARATMIGAWEVVPQEDVETALQQLPPTTLANMDQNALSLGHKLAANGILYGTVSRYRERVGFDYAAQTPAAVAFTLQFLDENTKQVVWTGKFAKEQKALTENVLDLPNFLSNRGRWVRAHDIAAQGVQESLEDLQSKLTVEPILQGK